MLAIKLSRTGKKKQPSYRVIVLEKTKDPWGDYLENLGFYNPQASPKVVELKADRIKYWLSMGAQPTDTVHNLLVTKGIIEAPKRHVTTISKRRAAKIAEKTKAAEPAAAPQEKKSETATTEPAAEA